MAITPAHLANVFRQVVREKNPGVDAYKETFHRVFGRDKEFTDQIRKSLKSTLYMYTYSSDPEINPFLAITPTTNRRKT